LKKNLEIEDRKKKLILEKIKELKKKNKKKTKI
jgi:hypothetical protein